jgi:predicted  nucleic acid-binding Zn-ribbon protein
MKSPEEIELAKKRRELADLLEEQSQIERELAAIKAEIRGFEHTYEQMLGGKIAELEQLEWQISGLLGTGETEEEHHKYFHTAEHNASTSTFTRTPLLDDDPDTTPIFEEKSLKALYREVAKSIHPDLANDDHERFKRQELMATANLAYQEGDRGRLQKLLREWQLGPKTAKGLDIGAELIRLIRQIAYARQHIKELNKRINELRRSDIYRFRQRVDDGLQDGIDLLAEMAATVDLDIAKARKRLALLNGDQEAPEERLSPPLETRIIRFPSEKSCGTLYLRNITSVDYRDWQKLGSAKGAREIPLDKGLRLDVRGDGENGITFLAQLQADDLQALFLYDVGDEAVNRISNLTGLQELYLSNTTVTDTGLSNLNCLTNLKRLYIYHTEITDNGLPNLYPLTWLRWLTFSGTKVTEKGLGKLRSALPNCKVVTFKWRYE